MRRPVLAVLALAVLAACQPAAIPLSEDDVAAIRALGTSYAQSNLANDADAVAAVYATDAVEMPPNMPARVGNAAIRDAYAEFFGLSVEVSEFTLTAVEIDGVDGMAFDRGTWTWTGTPPGMTEPVSENGKYLGVARRQEDGAWLWTSVIWNSDVPLPQPE
jgi:uncharacterized protein (TIGR02246 family)